jgi:hypothetical protein
MVSRGAVSIVREERRFGGARPVGDTGEGERMGMETFQAEDLRWLVCPACQGALALEAESVRCAGCGRHYPVVDGIPVLLADRTF